MDGSRPQELLEAILRDYCEHMEEEEEEEVVKKACDLVTTAKNLPPISEDPYCKVQAQWPSRIREKAANYDGPWKEPKNIADFMSSHPVLTDCTSTHAHPTSVIQFLALKFPESLKKLENIHFTFLDSYSSALRT